MPEYQLEIKQVVDYPRCRIYRQFIRTLMEDRNIRLCGCSYLFYFIVLCSYTNFRTSYRRIDGISYTIYPGEWVCKLSELTGWFRTRYQYQVLEILDFLQENHYITYSKLGRDRIVKFAIKGWKKHNKALDYNCPCQKDDGFFFFPISKVHELVSVGKCSEMDIVLDLWIHTIYNDPQVQGSEVGPVVYFRNATGSPLIGYSELGERWGLSKATVGRVLNKLSKLNYLSLMSFPGRHGSILYLRSYLSTMFQISDVMIDKEEVAMALNIKVAVPEESESSQQEPLILEEQIIVSKQDFSVSKTHIHFIIEKVAKILAVQGLSCCGCRKSIYKLYPLSNDCKETNLSTREVERCGMSEKFELVITCSESDQTYRFQLRLDALSK